MKRIISIFIFLSLILLGCKKSNIYSDVPSSTLIIDGVSYELELTEFLEGGIRPTCHATIGTDNPSVSFGFALGRFPTAPYIPIVGAPMREGVLEASIAIRFNSKLYFVHGIEGGYVVGEKKGNHLVYTLAPMYLRFWDDLDGDGYGEPTTDSIKVSGILYVK